MEKKCEWGKKSAMDSVLTSLQFYASVWIRRPENESENFGGKGRWYVKGMKVDEVIARLEGINCNGRGTSCPDQLAKALKSIKGE